MPTSSSLPPRQKKKIIKKKIYISSCYILSKYLLKGSPYHKKLIPNMDKRRSRGGYSTAGRERLWNRFLPSNQKVHGITWIPSHCSNDRNMELLTALTMFPTIQFSRKKKKRKYHRQKMWAIATWHTHTEKNLLSVIRLDGNGNSNHWRQRKTHLCKNRNWWISGINGPCAREPSQFYW